MSTTLARKAWRDLRRRQARALLTAATIALSVAGTGMLAVPALLDHTMNAEVRDARLYDVTLRVRDIEFGEAAAREVAAIPNVDAVSARVSFSTRVLVGDRRVPATLLGVADFGRQPINVVRVTGGTAPSESEVLADDGNSDAVDVALDVDDHVDVVTAEGSVTSLEVAGTARSMAFWQGPWDHPKHLTLYSRNETVQRLSGVSGVNTIELRLEDNSASAVDATVARMRTWLDENVGTDALTDLPLTRDEGEWPGREFTQQMSSFVYVLAGLAVVTAVFLIANTMNTLVAEQTAEIGVMKAIGGRRRQIAGVFLRSALYLAIAGLVVGVPLGILLASAISGFITSSILGVPGRFAVSLPIIGLSAMLAIIVTVTASGPALRRALRIPVRAALQGHAATTTFGISRIDHLLMHGRLLPRPVKFGVRNLARNKRRAAATTVQVALAVATALGLLNMAISFTRALDASYDALPWQASVFAPPDARPLDAAARRIAATTAGVERVEPVLQNEVEYGDESYPVLGMTATPLYEPDLRDGRWYDADEARRGAAVAVAGPNLARENNLEPGDTVTLRTAGGDVDVRIVGIDSVQMGDGRTFFVPLLWLQQVTGWHDATNLLWLSTTDRGDGAVDRASNEAEDALNSSGYSVAAEKLYELKAENKAANDAILNMIVLVGGVVVAISMVGLVNAISMSVIERTREIGVLRCVGARSRDIRRAFTAESVVQAALGWIVGIPLGWLLSRALVQLTLTIMELEIDTVFDPTTAVLVLVATVALSALVVLGPVRRATRIHPGDALRYV